MVCKENERNMIKRFVIFSFAALIALTGCNVYKDDSIQTANVEGIETIYIDHGSDHLLLKSVDQPYLEASFANKEIDLEQTENDISIRMEQNVFYIGPKINLNKKLQVILPIDFFGRVIIRGTSGNITAENLNTSEIEINEKSGNVTLDFLDYQSDVTIKTTSGDVNLILNTEQPDLKLNTKTASGKQTITLPIEIIKQNNKVFEGTSGNGTYSIELKTASGNIMIQ